MMTPSQTKTVKTKVLMLLLCTESAFSTATM